MPTLNAQKAQPAAERFTAQVMLIEHIYICFHTADSAVNATVTVHNGRYTPSLVLLII